MPKQTACQPDPAFTEYKPLPRWVKSGGQTKNGIPDLAGQPWCGSCGNDYDPTKPRCPKCYGPWSKIGLR